MHISDLNLMNSCRFLNWYPGEPNNQVLGSRPEDCAEMVPSWIYQWNDKKCNIEQLYICKKQGNSVNNVLKLGKCSYDARSRINMD
ncbi:hypothetical protein DPMN_114993 [Dreissena polymorpha]|uniref:C-type lectin domain-containing protein n=1 Tax=Dreissena polymorpha TaxID=45954 RepID=A0A9D4KLN4_DREPO|nr:hypothetical protein DPMN_114993 [Dreissena polymorpha]